MYDVIIPLSIVGLVQVTHTVLLLMLTTELMTGGLGAMDNHNNKIIIINTAYL